MTNKELAELERGARHEMDIFDRPSKRTALRLIEALATAREAEALRAENARLREGFTIADEVACDAIRNGYYVGEGAVEKLVAARAAIEQGEVK